MCVSCHSLICYTLAHFLFAITFLFHVLLLFFRLVVPLANVATDTQTHTYLQYTRTAIKIHCMQLCVRFCVSSFGSLLKFAAGGRLIQALLLLLLLLPLTSLCFVGVLIAAAAAAAGTQEHHNKQKKTPLTYLPVYIYTYTNSDGSATCAHAKAPQILTPSRVMARSFSPNKVSAPNQVSCWCALYIATYVALHASQSYSRHLVVVRGR